MTQADAAQAQKCAERIVDAYAARVKMGLLAQGELERAIVACLDRIPASDWVTTVNQLLDDWERTHAGKGPRIASIGSGAVTEKPRAFF